MVQAGPVTWGSNARDGLLTALSEQHGPALTAYAARLLGDGEVAQECVQDTLERAYRWLPVLLARGQFRPTGWLYRTLKNRCLDALRHRSGGRSAAQLRTGRLRVREVPLPDDGQPDADHLPDTSATLDRVRLVRSVLAALPARQRDALWLRDGCGYPPHEIGARLGLTPGGARVFLTTARKAFRAKAGEMGYTQYAGEWVSA